MIVLGLSKSDLAKPTITEVGYVYVHGGKGGRAEVCVGDQVELFKKDDDFLNKHLGPGPYTITWTAQWRCGMDYLQVKSAGGKSMGVNASEFKTIS